MKIKTFEEWMEQVDKHISKTMWGLTSRDLPYICYRDLYDSGASPARAALRAINNADDL